AFAALAGPVLVRRNAVVCGAAAAGATDRRRRVRQPGGTAGGAAGVAVGLAYRTARRGPRGAVEPGTLRADRVYRDHQLAALGDRVRRGRAGRRGNQRDRRPAEL